MMVVTAKRTQPKQKRRAAPVLFAPTDGPPIAKRNPWGLIRVLPDGKQQTMRERVTELLHNPRHSMQDVAMTLQDEYRVYMTRNMIIGMNKRLGLQGKYPRGAGGGERKKMKVKPASNLKGRGTTRGMSFARGGGVVFAPKPDKVLELPKPPEQVALNPAPFMELAFGRCKWPVHGDGMSMLCCNDTAVDAKPYCRHHMREQKRVTASPTTQVYKAPNKLYR